MNAVEIDEAVTELAGQPHPHVDVGSGGRDHKAPALLAEMAKIS
jgi:hypothetical protein